MTYYTPYQNECEAKEAFNKVISSAPSEIAYLVEQNSLANSFAAEVHGEYNDDLHRWTVAVSTALMYIDQGVGEF